MLVNTLTASRLSGLPVDVIRSLLARRLITPAQPAKIDYAGHGWSKVQVLVLSAIVDLRRHGCRLPMAVMLMEVLASMTDEGLQQDFRAGRKFIVVKRKNLMALKLYTADEVAAFDPRPFITLDLEQAFDHLMEAIEAEKVHA